MRERPIIFGAESVRAIRAGRKTQTRRVMKPQPPEWVNAFGFTAFTPSGSISGRGSYEDKGPAEKFFRCPYGLGGDRLWVRETWINGFRLAAGEWTCIPFVGAEHRVFYRATDQIDGKENEPQISWKSPIFMPRWASRLTLEVTDVRVERVQDISEADAVAEGCEARPAVKSWSGFRRLEDGYRMFVQGGASSSGPAPDWMESAELQTVVDPVPAREVYRHAWDALNAKRGFSWESNPFVWVISFSVLPR